MKDFSNLSLIDKAIYLEDFISNYEPFTLMQAVAFIDSFENFKSENSSITGMSLMIPEYIALLCLKKPYPTEENFEFDSHLFFPTIRELNAKIQIFLSSVLDDASDKIHSHENFSEIDKLAISYLIQEFYLRNPVPNFLHKKVIEAIYLPVKDKLKSGLGFDCNEALLFTDSVIDLLDNIMAEKRKDIDKQIKGILKGQPIPDLMQDRLNNLPKDFGFETLKDKLNYLYILYEGILDKHTYLFDEDELIDFSNLDENTVKSCLNAFSIKFGEVTSEFYIPTSTHPLRKTPLISNDGKYFLPSTPLLSWSLENKFDKYLLQHDNKFSTKRHDAVISIACNSIKEVFKRAEVHTHLHYENYKHELDALILIDCVAIIIECKANRISDKAKLGRKDRIESHLKDLVKKSHEQSTSAINFLKSNQSVEFYNKTQKVKIDTTNIKKIYPITLTLEPLSSLGVLIKKVNDLGIASGTFPWIISIYDLLIISEHNPFPSIFFHYIERRNLFATYPNFWGHDEIDLFSWYMEFGLDITSLSIPKDENIFFSHNSDHINKYLYINRAKGNL